MAGAAGPCAAGAEVAAAGSGVGAAAVIAAAPSARAVCAVSTGGDAAAAAARRKEQPGRGVGVMNAVATDGLRLASSRASRCLKNGRGGGELGGAAHDPVCDPPFMRPARPS